MKASEPVDSSLSNRPLEGLLVVSVEQALAAPLASCRLADLGARVIKVERPEGDFARGYDQAVFGMASYFAWTNRGKESLTLDFKRAEDAALLWRLCAQADVFIQNLLPGALDRAGFSADALRQRNPRLVTCSISGYGDGDATRHLKAYDLLVQCESGLVSVSGAPGAPGRIGVSICDIGAGMNAATAVLAALALRERTGQGCHLEVSLFDGAADWMAVPYLHQVYGQGAAGPAGLQHPSIAPYGAYRSADDHTLVISIQNDREWQRFAQSFLQQPALGADERFASNALRVRHRDALDALIQNAFRAMPLDMAIAALNQAGTAFGQVRSVADLVHHPALRTTPMSVGGQRVAMVASPLRGPWDAEQFRPAPALGEHDAAIRSEFG
jgi:crotonobetainyl-CoA:carnitine CoA-transferase CaiB-like acyl-CoA transferase